MNSNNSFKGKRDIVDAMLGGAAKRVLVCGGNGALGSSLVRYFKEKQYVMQVNL